MRASRIEIDCECGRPKASAKNPCCSRCALLDGVSFRAGRGGKYHDVNVIGLLRECPAGVTIEEFACQLARKPESVLRTLQRLMSTKRVARRAVENAFCRTHFVYVLALPKELN